MSPPGLTPIDPVRSHHAYRRRACATHYIQSLVSLLMQEEPQVSEDAADAEGVDDLWPASAIWELLAYVLRDLGFNHKAVRKCGLLCQTIGRAAVLS